MNTGLLEWSYTQLRRAKLLVGAVPIVLRTNGGVRPAASKIYGICQREGWSGFKKRVLDISQISLTAVDENGDHVNRHDYTEWIRRYDTLDEAKCNEILNSIERMPRLPKISIIMPVYDPPVDLLEEAICSVRKQLYGAWELCIADDASKNEAVRILLEKHAGEDQRIKIVYRTENGHISRASNSALELATGEYIALLDNDDILPAHALFHVAQTILENPDVGVIYSDEDKLNLVGLRIDPYFKCDWNPELFLGHNMISHFGVYKTNLVNAVGGFRVGYEGSQDYDLAARVIEHLEPEQIIHIPKVLYHWRMLPGSASMGTSEKPYAIIASEKALNEHLARKNIKGCVQAMPLGMHHVHFELPDPAPLVSIIIPTRDAAKLVSTCVTSILDLTIYKNYEILLIDNGSTDIDAINCFNTLSQSNKNFRIIRDDSPFNFSALNNKAVKQANGELIVLLNNDTEVISPTWLTDMASIALRPDVGVVGAKLYYPNHRLQHGGVILGLGASRIAGHMHHNISMDNYGYYGRAILTQEISAVTAACMAVRKSIYEEIGGFDEKLEVAFNDIDFCLKVRKAGYRNIWTPHAELYHYESITRGSDDNPDTQARFSQEAIYMQERWGALLTNDPAYNPNLTLDHSDFSLAWPPRGISQRYSNVTQMDLGEGSINNMPHAQTAAVTTVAEDS